MILNIPDFVINGIITGLSAILIGMIRYLLKSLKNLHELITENNKNNVSCGTFNELKQTVNIVIDNLNIVKLTQASHEEHLKNQDKILEEIKKKVYS